MLHLEREATLHSQRLMEAAEHARLVEEARAPREQRPSLFSRLAGPLFHRRPAARRSAQPVPVPARLVKPQAW